MASSIKALANFLSPQPMFHPHQERISNMFQQRHTGDFFDPTQIRNTLGPVHKDGNFMVSPRSMKDCCENYTYEQL